MSLQEPQMGESPLKKKRGRPAKSNKLSNRITTRINIDVNTSPLSASPTAESNALKSIEQGAPDCFTPLMRVSPTNRNVKRRRSTNSNSTTSMVKTPSLKKQKTTSAANKLTTPLQLTSAADHMSMITNGESHPNGTDATGDEARASVPFYTPPSSVSSIRISNINSSVLAPPVELSKVAAQLNGNSQSQDLSSLSLKGMDFKLTVDNLGKAVWSEGIFNFGIVGKPSATKTSKSPLKASLSVPTPENSKDSPAGDEIDFNGSPRGGGLRRVNSDSTTISTSTTLTAFSTSVGNLNLSDNNAPNSKNNGSTLPSLAYNTDLLNHGSPTLPLILENTPKYNFAPQTPRSKENYFYGISTGLTPNPLMGTPHYNQFMFLVLEDAQLSDPASVHGLHSHSLMTGSPYLSQLLSFGTTSITGTPGLRNTLNSIASLRQRVKTDDFAINMNEIMKMDSHGMEDPLGGPLALVHTVGSGRSSPTKAAKEDTSDARLALKRIISTKRT